MMALTSTCGVVFALFVAQLSAFSPRPHHFAEQYEAYHGHYPQDLPEPFLKNVRQITFEGVNAEAYWSFDGTQFSFQAIRGSLGESHPCDQIYTMSVNGTNIQHVSSGEGRDTCSFYTPNKEYVLYSSTAAVDGPFCPPTPEVAYGYIWPIYHSMEIYRVHLRDGVREQLTKNDFYDAELTLSPDGSKAIFTSDRDGDLELYMMNTDGTGLRRMTYTPGYDGGAWFSHDNQKLVWRANRPSGANLTDYLNLLKLGITTPNEMQIFTMDIATMTTHRLTSLPGANFAPVFTPDDKAIIFASNMKNPMSGEFHLYMIDTQGGNLQQVTFNGMFNSFPMFSPDGKYLAWESSRNAAKPMEINVFIAEWNAPSNEQFEQFAN